MNNDKLLSNKQTNKQTNVNPKGPHGGQGIPFKNFGIPVPLTDEWQAILKDLRKLAGQDGTSLAWVLREALIEYHHRHFPGNPAVPLENFTGKLPFSPAAKEKLKTSTSDITMPDYGNMSIEALEDLLAHPWKVTYGDRQIIVSTLQRKKKTREK